MTIAEFKKKKKTIAGFKESQSKLKETPFYKRESIGSLDAAIDRNATKAANSALQARMAEREAERLAKIKAEKFAQAAAAAKPIDTVEDKMARASLPTGIKYEDRNVTYTKKPVLSDINRSAANVDYSREIKSAEDRYAAENPVLTPREQLKRNVQKYNPLAIADMMINKAGAGVVQSGAALGDAVGASVASRKENDFTRYIDNARNTLRSMQNKAYPTSQANAPDKWDVDNKVKYYQGETLQDQAESYTRKIDERYIGLSDTFVTKSLSDLAQSTGYMIPTMVTNAILPGAGTALLFASGYSQGERQAIQAGASPEDARNYALLNGLNQSAGELLIGGVLWKGTGLLDSAFKRAGLDLASKITNPVLKKAFAGTMRILGESAEEAIQNVADTFARRATYDTTAKIDPSAVAYDALLGGGMSALFGVAGNVKNLALPSVQAVTAEPPKPQTFFDRHSYTLKDTELKLNTNLRDAAGDETVARLKTAKTNLERTGILSGASDEVIKQISDLQAASGLDMEFYNESSVNGYIKNGFTKNGKIYLNAKSDKTGAWVLSHELHDNLEGTESFKKLRDLVKTYEGDNFARKRAELIATYKNGGVDLTESEADREIVSNYSADNLFTNYDAIYNVVKTDRTLGEKIHTWISGMITKLTGTQEEKYLLKARELYTRALDELRQSDTVKADTVMASVSKTDSEGNALSDTVIERNKASKVRNAEGQLIPMYHATNADFTVFDKSKIGSSGAGRYLGYGFNFAASEGTAEQYGNNVMKTYLNVSNPITDTEKTISPANLSNLIQKVDSANPDFSNDVTQSLAWDYSPNGYTINPNDSETVQQMKYKRAVREAAKAIYDSAENDADIYSAISVGQSTSEAVMDTFSQFGKDGVIWHNEDGNIRYAVTFESNQAKKTDNANPTDNPDIRYSVSESDDAYMQAVNNGDTDTAQKMVDEAAKKAGYNVKAYHGTTAKKFNEFTANSYFSPEYKYAERYSHVLQSDGTNEPKVYAVYLQPGNVKKVPFSTVSREAFATLDKAKRDTMLIKKPLFEDGVPEYIVKNSSQIKSADPITYDGSGKVIPLSQRFNKRSDDIRYSVSKVDSDGKETRTPVSPFYSKLAREIDTAKQDKFASSGLIQYLTGRGVKADEIKWLGLESFIEGKKSVTKAELLEYLKANDLEIEEVTKDNQEDESSTKYHRYIITDENETYREVLFTLPNVNGNFQSQHWDEENVVAHTRLQDLADEDGNKVLFVEEVQSDWHEKGREEGYKTDEIIASAKQERKTLEQERTTIIKKYNSDDNLFAARRLMNEEDRQREREISTRLAQLVDVGSMVSDAPFKSTWHEFVLKRILRMAAEGGYDKVAWTTGKMQSDRYNLEKQISKITIKRNEYAERPNGEGLYYVDSYDKQSQIITGIPRIITAKEVTNIYGKDLGARLVKMADSSDEISTIEGDNLRIGGEGMHNFYDIGGTSSQNIPRYLNKYVKQWGSSVSETTLETGDVVPSVDITDSMRNSVLYEGQPKFSISEADSDGNELSDEQREFFKDSKVTDDKGQLITVYHGTNEDFTVFDKSMIGNNFGQDEKGFFFTDNKASAESYANTTSYGTTRKVAGKVIGTYLNIANPLVININYDPINEWDSNYKGFLNRAEREKRDGIIIKARKYESLYVAFEPEQIKSVDNRNPTSDPDIRYSVTKDNSEYFRKRAYAEKMGKESLRARIAEIDAKYAVKTQHSDDELSRIITQEEAENFYPEPTEADNELRLASILSEGDERFKKEAENSEEYAKIVLMTEAEALLKDADPIRKDIAKYQQAKKDYRAAVEGRKSDSTSESDVIDAADKMDKARNAVLAKLEKRDARVESMVQNDTFADSMQKQYDKLKQLQKDNAPKEQIDELKAFIADINRRRKALLYKEADAAVGDVTKWKDKGAGIRYQRETLERNIRDIAPDKETADKVIQTYRRPIDKNEAKSTKYKTDYRNQVRDLKISRSKTGKNRDSESTAVQFIGEYDYMISSSKGETKAQYQQELDDFIAANPDMDLASVRAKAAAMHVMYDDIFQQINKTRLENGYPSVDYRKGYFPHFSENKPDTLLGKMALAFGINANPDGLPTSINGLTYQFKPGTTWFGNLLRRTGLRTDYDAVKGFNRYIEGASDIIHHTGDLQRLRALAGHIRSAGSEENLKKQAKLIQSDDTMTAEQQHEAIAKLYEGTKYALSNFVVNLDEYTNQLANKKARSDRDTEDMVGRKFYRLMKTLEQRIAANMIGGNPRSWTTNFIPIHQAAAQISNKNMIYGSLSTLKSWIKEDGITNASSFLTNRRGSEPLVKTATQVLRDAVSKPMSMIDDFSSNVIVRSRYYQNIEKGMPHAEAMDEADAFANSVMAGRSKGSTPTLFGAMNPLLKPFTMFQLEQNNQLSYFLKDLPREQKEKGAAMLIYAMLKFIIGAYLFDDLYEWIMGSRPALDPLGVVNKSVGEFTGYQLPNTAEWAKELITEKRLPEPEDFWTEKKTIRKAGANTAKRIAEELPFIGGVMGGGRLPIQAGFPDIGAMGNAIGGYMDKSITEEKARNTIIKEMSNPLFYLFPPFAGGQAKKIIQGIEAVNKSGSWTMDSEGNDILQYPIFKKNPLTYARATVFGKSTLPTASEWVDNDFKNLPKKASAAYATLAGLGEDAESAYTIIEDIARSEKTDVDSLADVQREKLSAAPISGAMKYEMYSAMLASDSDLAIMDELETAGLSKTKIFDTITQYRDLNSSKLKADEKSLNWERWMDDQKYTEEQRAIIDERINFRVAISVEASSYKKLTEAGIDADIAYDISDSLSDLEPLEGKTSVSNAQQYRLIADSDYDDADKARAMSVLMEESTYLKFKKATLKGVSMKKYVDFVENSARIESDTEDGKAITDSKREKLLTMIDKMILTTKQKNALYYAAGYAESRIDEAPWYNGERYDGDIYQTKSNGMVLRKLK